MSFEELLDKACSVAGLPDMARVLLPSALSDETKQILLKLSPDEVGNVLYTAIDAVNKGSVEPIDKLVRKQVGR
jgi:hypothetical protein